MIIQPNVIKTIKADMNLKAVLCRAFRKHFGTIERWINQNHDDGPLTTVKAVEVLKKEMGLKEDRILLLTKDDKEFGLTEDQIFKLEAVL